MANKIKNKIKQLLSLAENTPYETEREIALHQASILMLKNSLTRNDLRSTEEIISKDFYIPGIAYRNAVKRLWYRVGAATGTVLVLAREQKKGVTFTLCGFASDVDNLSMIMLSLTTQAFRAMGKFWVEERDYWKSVSKYSRFKVRESFLYGFSQAVAERLERAVGEVVTEADSGAIVLADRGDAVRSWAEKEFDFTTVKSRAVQVHGSALDSGVIAGESADIGAKRVTVDKLALGGGVRERMENNE